MSGSKSPVQRTGCGVSFLQMFVVLGLLGLLFFALLWPAVSTPHGGYHRTECRNHLKQIGLALWNYHDTYGSLPPAIVYGPDGKPWHSWRTLILPYLEEQKLYDRYDFDEPWNGPNNSRLAEEAGSPPFFHCRADEQATAGETSYVAVTGDGTLWPRDGAISLNDVPDGLSNTILVVELSDSGVHWMEPRDLPIDKMNFEIGAEKGVGIRGRHGPKHWFRENDLTVAHVLLADGTVPIIGVAGLKPETVRSLLLRDDDGPEEGWWETMLESANE